MVAGFIYPQPIAITIKTNPRLFVTTIRLLTNAIPASRESEALRE